MPGRSPPSPPPIPDNIGIGNNGFWLQPSIIGGGVAACMGEFAVGSGEGAVCIDPSGELFSALAGGRIILGDLLISP